MKLYVWSNPHEVDYGDSALFVVAETLEEAKEFAAKGKAYAYNVFEQSIPTVELGDPTRIVDVPCAEWHVWKD